MNGGNLRSARAAAAKQLRWKVTRSAANDGDLIFWPQGITVAATAWAWRYAWPGFRTGRGDRSRRGRRGLHSAPVDAQDDCLPRRCCVRGRARRRGVDAWIESDGSRRALKNALRIDGGGPPAAPQSCECGRPYPPGLADE